MTPDGKAETVYELCELTCEAIETKPWNYNQDYFRNPVETCLAADSLPTVADACGTAYCRAGWMAALSLEQVALNHMDSQSIGRYATDMLVRAGVPRLEVSVLFTSVPDATGGFHDLAAEDETGESHPYIYGSPEYIAAGLRGMRDIMQRYEQQLKATPVEAPTP